MLLKRNLRDKNKFLLNTGLVSAARIVEQLIAYLVVVLISRNLGADGLGKYSFIFAFAGFFFIFSDWGLSFLMTKDISQDFRKTQRYFSNIISLKGILALISLTIYSITILFIGKDDLLPSLFVVGILTFFSSFKDVPFAILRAKTKGFLIAITNVTEKLLILILGYFVLVNYSSLYLFVLVLLLAKITYLLSVFIAAKKYYEFKFSFDKNFLFGLLKKSYPFLFIGVFSMIYIQMDSIMLSFMKGDVVVGWYNSGYKLITMLNMVPLLLLTFGFPELSRLFNKDKTRLKGLFEEIVRFSLIIIIPIIVGVIFLGGRVLEFIYHFNSVESAIAFSILIVTELFVYLTTIYGHLITSANKQSLFAKIAGFGAVINVMLNFVLIPMFSLYGAAVATLITYLFMFILMDRFIRKNFFSYHLLKLFIVPLVFSLVMGVIIHILSAQNVLVIIFSAGICYIIPVFLVEYRRMLRRDL